LINKAKMKKLYFILLLLPFLILTGCIKTLDAVPNTKVVYSYTGNIYTTYNVTYTDGSGAPISLQFQGSNWSKTITTYPSTAFKSASFTINTASPSPNVVGGVTISVNDKVVINENNLTFGNTSNGYFYSAVVF
jgi:hypothetical protein